MEIEVETDGKTAVWIVNEYRTKPEGFTFAAKEGPESRLKSWTSVGGIP